MIKGMKKKKLFAFLFAVALTAVGSFGIVQGAQAATPTWDSYCMGCHGSASSFGAHTVAQIQSAISSFGAMKSLSSLSATQLQAISNELSGSTTDTTGPSVSISSPTGGTVSGTVTVTATASDNTGGSGMAGVQFKVDGVNVGAEDTTSPYSVSWNTTTLANGSHNLTAVARDVAGNTTTSATVTVTVNNGSTTGPTVSITSPPAGTVSATVAVTASASDNAGVVGVQFKLDGANYGPEVAASPYSISWDTTTATNGPHSLTAVARNSAGNTTSSAAVTVTVSNASPGSDTGSDMTNWVGTWFKVRVDSEGYSVGETAMTPVHDTIAGYLEITAWNSDTKIFEATLHGQNDAEAGWSSIPLQLRYISGSSQDLLCWSQVTGDTDNYGFTARIRARMRKGVLVSATFKTVGGYYVQSLGLSEASANASDSDASDHQDRAGWLKIGGKLIDISKVPADLTSH